MLHPLMHAVSYGPCAPAAAAAAVVAAASAAAVAAAAAGSAVPAGAPVCVDEVVAVAAEHGVRLLLQHKDDVCCDAAGVLVACGAGMFAGRWRAGVSSMHTERATSSAASR